jgi:hypothetical protein
MVKRLVRVFRVPFSLVNRVKIANFNHAKGVRITHVRPPENVVFVIFRTLVSDYLNVSEVKTKS